MVKLPPSDLISVFLEFVEARRAPLTLASYTTSMRVFRHFLRESRLAVRKREVDPKILDAFLIWLRARGNVPATIETRLQAVKSFFAWAVKRRYLRETPFLLWEIPRVTESLPRSLTFEEESRLIDVVSQRPRTRYDASLFLAVRLGRFAGLRVGECANLTWADFDPAKAILMVRKGKGGRDRSIPIPHDGLFRHVFERWEKMGRPCLGSVLIGLNARPLSGRAIRRSIGRLFTAARIQDASFHLLRATYATRLAQLGVHLATIQRLMGHSSPRTTMLYVDVADESKRQAADLLDRPLDEIRRAMLRQAADLLDIPPPKV